MANEFGNASFIYCTPLIEARPVSGKSPNQFRLIVNYEPRSEDNPYKRFEIYRFIGDLNVNEENIASDDPRFKIIQKYDWTGDSTPREIIDDLTDYYERDENTLSSFHDVSDRKDRELLDEVYSTQRAIYYTIATYVKLTLSASPYVAVSHEVGGYMEVRSNKTQVLHNMLWHEGDRIWSKSVDNDRLSRTSIDVNRVFKNGAHSKPTGIGGWVWAAKRKNGTVFQYALKNGGEPSSDSYPLRRYYNNDISGDGVIGGGHGLSVDPYSGACFHGVYNGAGSMYYLIPSDVANAQPRPFYGVGGGCYGVTQVPGLSGYFASIDRPNGVVRVVNTNTTGSGAIVPGTPVNGSTNGTTLTIAGSAVTFMHVRGTDGNQLYGICSSNVNNKVLWTSDPSEGNFMRGLCTSITDTPSSEVLYSSWSGHGIYYKTQSMADFALIESFDAYGCGVDSENNLWVCDTEGKLRKYYRGLSDNDSFPYGGDCRYPAVRLGKWPFSMTNDIPFEWFLTRDSTFMTNLSTATIGAVTDTAQGFYNLWVKTARRRFLDFGDDEENSTIGSYVTGSINASNAFKQEMLDNIKAFDAAFCDETSTAYFSGNLVGRKVYDSYNSSTTTPVIFDNDPNLGNSYMYSDFTGSNLIGLLDGILSTYDLIHPGIIQPSIKLSVSGQEQSQNGLQEEYEADAETFSVFENGYVRENSTPLSMSVTGYDDLSVNYSAHLSPGTFSLSTFNFRLSVENFANSLNDNIENILDVYNDTAPESPEFLYTFYDPSLRGLSGAYTSWFNGTSSFGAVVSANYTQNVYGDNVVLNSMPVYVTVLERWPQPVCYTQGYDLSASRMVWCGETLVKEDSAMQREVYRIYGDGECGKMIAPSGVLVGTDPISANIYDYSVARTYPISSVDLRIESSDSWNTYQDDYTKVIGFDTSRNDHRDVPSFITGSEFRYGTHKLTMNANASATGTSAPESFVTYISVLEFEPFANFDAISAMTVPSGYSDNGTITQASALATTVSITPTLISGYAPYLWVRFVDASVAHTFPISAYEWNFGDYYSSTNIQTVTATTLSGNFSGGCWTTDVVGNSATHVYTMPGFYDVTLTVRASTTETSDLCTKPADVENLIYVYVEEIPLTADFGINDTSVSGAFVGDLTLNLSTSTGVTVFVNPSSTSPGSFPIGRIEWDFGDGSDIVAVTRYTTPVYYNSSAYLDDMGDPRNYIVPHTYMPGSTDYSSLVVWMTAFASNTNTYDSASCTVGNISAIRTEYVNADLKHLVDIKTFDVTDSAYLAYEVENVGLINTYLSGL